MSKTKMLTIASFCTAMAFVLNQISVYRMPMGGSITPFSMLFIVLAGYLLGPLYGVLSGVALGLLDTITGAYIVHPLQYILDYILGFGALGLSGFFRKMKFGLYIGYVVGVLGRFIMVFLSGYFFFYMFAGDYHPALFSFLYNITYIGPEMIITLIVISIPAVRIAIDRMKMETSKG
ncbi:MAG: energy-coupled thiamine transporter ThiT [Defluviitaleaceae bacterium]|nr:energy-coupled thiamine transporter ThiT [Defluviitaleaceae bacterium]